MELQSPGLRPGGLGGGGTGETWVSCLESHSRLLEDERCQWGKGWVDFKMASVSGYRCLSVDMDVA